MDARQLHEEITSVGNPGQWACRATTVWLEHACGRMRGHDGDHAEVHDDDDRTVTIWAA